MGFDTGAPTSNYESSCHLHILTNRLVCFLTGSCPLRNSKSGIGSPGCSPKARHLHQPMNAGHKEPQGVEKGVIVSLNL
jgi:hypothetical protein